MDDFAPDDDPNLGSDLDDLAARALKKAVRASPGLLASLLLHAAILALLPFIIFFERFAEPESVPVQIGLGAARVDSDRSYKPSGGGVPSLETKGEEPVICFPEAVPGDHNESRDGEDAARIKGESYAVEAHLLDRALEGSLTGRGLAPFGGSSSIGAGGGSAFGPRFGGPAGGRRDLALRSGGSAQTEAAVEAGLAWLARHARADGGWASYPSCGECGAAGDNLDVAGTGLAVCSFLAAGYGPAGREGSVVVSRTKTRRSYSSVVEGGLRQLAKAMDAFTKRTGDGDEALGMYDWAFGTLALCEAVRAGGSEWREAAKSAIQWLENARNPRAAWRYHPRCGQNDLSVTGACVQALKSARLAGIPVKVETLEGVREFLESVTDEVGRCGYTARGNGRPAMTAIGIFVRRFLEPRTTLDGRLHRAAAFVANDLAGPADESDPQRVYESYYAMLGLHDLECPMGASWRLVNGVVTQRFTTAQKKGGCADGSWEPDAWATSPVLTTAFCVLSLEVYYRYAPTEPAAPPARR